MNAWGVVVLAAVLLEYALELAVNVLTVRTLDPDVPAEFRDVYDPARYRRAQEYTRVRTTFGAVAETTSVVAFLAFWFAGGFAWLDRLVRRPGLGPVPTGLLFIGALAVGRALLAIPFRWWPSSSGSSAPPAHSRGSGRGSRWRR